MVEQPVRQAHETERPVIICAPNRAPVTCLWPLAGHHLQGARMRAQAYAAKPLAKRLWAFVLNPALAGAGLARMVTIMCAPILPRGLLEVLADMIASDEEQIYAVFLGGAHMPQRVRAFLDFVVPRLQRFLEGND